MSDANTNDNPDQGFSAFMERLAKLGPYPGTDELTQLTISAYRDNKMRYFATLMCILKLSQAAHDQLAGIRMVVTPDGCEVLEVTVHTITAEILPMLSRMEVAWRLLGGDYTAITSANTPEVSEAQMRDALGGGSV